MRGHTATIVRRGGSVTPGAFRSCGNMQCAMLVHLRGSIKSVWDRRRPLVLSRRWRFLTGKCGADYADVKYDIQQRCSAQALSFSRATHMRGEGLGMISDWRTFGTLPMVLPPIAEPCSASPAGGAGKSFIFSHGQMYLRCVCIICQIITFSSSAKSARVQHKCDL